jgi:hypothetical protein
MPNIGWKAPYATTGTSFFSINAAQDCHRRYAALNWKLLFGL